MVGRYTRGRGGVLHFEGPRPGPGWHRHDWRARRLRVVGDDGAHDVVVVRRRWRLGRSATTHLDRAPDEVGGIHVATLVVLVKLASWLLSGDGLHVYEEPVAALEPVGSRRSVQRWLARVLTDAARAEGALRTAVIERSEPQPVERLFPGGVSPPAAIQCRRWKDPDATYRLATGLAYLVDGAVALLTSATVLLAEAQSRLDGPLGTLRT